MPNFFVKNEQIKNNNIYITDSDVNHISNVLRLKVDANINIIDENQNQYLCKIINIDKKVVECEIVEKLDINNEPSVNITLFQCLAKFEKMEYIIQKATELGIKEFVPVISNRVIVKLDDKAKAKKMDRWHVIAKGAAEQSKRNCIPEIKNIIFYKDICNLVPKYDIILVAYEQEKESLKKILAKVKSNVQNIGIIIGPEGGFEQSEIDLLKKYNNTYIISLGKTILRTETASISLISNILYEFNEM